MMILIIKYIKFSKKCIIIGHAGWADCISNSPVVRYIYQQFDKVYYFTYNYLINIVSYLYNDLDNLEFILYDIGKKINKTLLMRLNFKSDEYIKPINTEGYNKYYISNYGNVFNEDKMKLDGHKNLQGYIFVRLKQNDKSELFRVHRLVCEVFNGKTYENKNIVDHINRIRDDNRAVNLRWVTQKENMNNKNKPNLNKNEEVINYYLLLSEKHEIFTPLHI